MNSAKMAIPQKSEAAVGQHTTKAGEETGGSGVVTPAADQLCLLRSAAGSPSSPKDRMSSADPRPPSSGVQPLEKAESFNEAF